MTRNKQQVAIYTAAKKARENWADYTAAQEVKIYAFFSDLERQLLAEINRQARGGKLPSTQQARLLTSVKQHMDELRPRLRGHVRRQMARAVDDGITASILSLTGQVKSGYEVQVGTSYIAPTGRVMRYNAAIETFASSAWYEMHHDALDFLFKMPPGGITLQQCIWDVSWGMEKGIRNRIAQAVALGEPSSRVARDIQRWVGLPEQFVKAGLEEMHLGPGVYRSAYKNALRVSRTEMSRAFVEGGRRYMAVREWIQGVIHRTSGVTPCPVCADLEGTYYPRSKTSQIPVHPHCMCWEEMIVNVKALAA